MPDSSFNSQDPDSSSRPASPTAAALVTLDNGAEGGDGVGQSVPVFVPYARFLERRAWRAKIAADFHQLSDASVLPTDSNARPAARVAVEGERVEPPMPNTNPGRDLACPVCPKKLRYVTTRNADGHVHQKHDTFKTIADVHVYECASHGRFHVGPNGRINAGS